MILIVGGYAQGKEDFAKKNFPAKKIWKDFHLFVKEELKEQISQEEILNKTLEHLEAEPETIIICDELGCGIVPIEKSDRQWREVTGRLLCTLAEKAEAVYRVTCGIGVKIK